MAQTSQNSVQSVQAIGLTVSDADRAIDYFTGAFTFKVDSDITVSGEEADYLFGVFGSKVRLVTLRLGQEQIRLMQFLSPAGQPAPTDTQSNDLWFQHFAMIVTDMDKAFQRLQDYPYEAISTEPQTLPGGIQAFKFRDFDGHGLELLLFPEGIGSDRWHQPTDDLFLGIDHSAISISSTQQSLAFYKDILGFELAGDTLNQGPTQGHLDGLFGAKVIVTSLSPAQGGLGVEFLDYLTPPGGRPAPLSHRTNDLIHMQYEFVVSDIEATVEALEKAQAQFVSPKIVDLSGTELPFQKAVLLQDRDRHAILLVQN
ncbi:VOC family protein [Romeria aff. gracilis LEGE 07310]|uniref:VOC family protein n=1 Tax=Vasconcelosia minhoensis LEGE 07310 TaxID=915328 RepID=A0A8J7DK85_9CYAN|nr:VOC family protein [Romeria gracilis]MBE9076086.1 VOC family protein [Romeria aff. gracilis LEGE 07310]